MNNQLAPTGATRRRGVHALAAVAALTILLASAPTAYAGPPDNDMFSAPVVLTGAAGAQAGTNVEATGESGEPLHADAGRAHSVWYRWTAPFTGVAAVDTCTSDFDTVLGVYVGTTLPTLLPVAANDDHDDCEDAGSGVSFRVAAGATYHVAVAGFGAASGAFELRWRLSAPPANDAFSAAQPLEGAEGRVEGTSFGASEEAGEPLHSAFAGGESVWYSWTAPRGSIATFDGCGEAGALVAVYAGASLPGLRRVAEAGCRVRVPTAAGDSFRIAVEGSSARAFALAWSVGDPPANDAFAASTELAGPTGSMPGSLTLASRETDEPAAGEDGRLASVWYRWTAPRSTYASFGSCGSTSPTVVAVYTGGPGPAQLTRVTVAEEARCENGTAPVFRARRGVVYHVAVAATDGSRAAFSLRWGPVPAPERRCEVPDVRGLGLAAAKRRLERAGCALARVTRTRSRLVPRGRVVAQSRRPWITLRGDVRVSLELSGGRPPAR